MKDFKSPSIMSGKKFKGTNSYNDGVQYGPNTCKQEKHPVDTLLDKSIGSSESFYEPTGYIKCDPSKVEYLKS